jgi:4-oxalomesaconate tautomerase
MCLASPPREGGAIATRNFIPHTVHKAIGVFGAVSVATACVLPGSAVARIARIDGTGRSRRLNVEHPTGYFTVEMDVESDGRSIKVQRAALLRTARKLMAGNAFVPESIWDGTQPAVRER